jgi:tRNA dimethylallyltransferase
MSASTSELPLVIVLLGPTASGKTALSIELAQRLDLAVISVDSRQLYAGMDIGTAKPTPAQRQQVPHHLLDLRPPDRPINLQEFRAEAEAVITAEHRRRGVAFLVGGSGLYLQALTQGLQPPAVPPQPQLRAQLTAWMKAQDDQETLCNEPRLLADPASTRPGAKAGTDQPATKHKK